MKPEIEYPNKMYPTKSGVLFSSQQMAEMQAIGIKKLNDQLASTINPKKIKLLKNRLREIRLWLLVHPDAKQFMK